MDGWNGYVTKDRLIEKKRNWSCIECCLLIYTLQSKEGGLYHCLCRDGGKEVILIHLNQINVLRKIAGQDERIDGKQRAEQVIIL